MRMKTLRRLKKLVVPKIVRRFDLTDVTLDVSVEADAGPTPEAVFDRITGPYGRRHGTASIGAFDEET
jgi:hypothetical protein